MTSPGPAPAGSPAPARPARRATTDVLLVLPVAVLLLVAAWLVLSIIGGPDTLGLAALMPLGVPAGDAVTSAVAGLTALLVAIGLARHKTWLALVGVAVFGAGALVHAELLNGVMPAAVDVVALLALLAALPRLVAGTGRRGLATAVLVFTLGGILLLARVPGLMGDGLRVAIDGLLEWLSLAGAGPTGSGPLPWLPAGVALLVASACLLQAMGDLRTTRERERAREVLLRLGQGSLLPYQRQAPASAVADKGGDAVLAYARAGRSAVVLGDPAGEPGPTASAFAAWVAEAERRDWSPVVYQASEPECERLVGQGWHGLLVGMEAIIDPSAFRLGTPRLGNVRHTVTRSRKGGVTVAWSARGLPDSPDPARLAAGLTAIDQTWRRTAGPQMGFTVGQYDGAHLGDAGIAAATDEHGDVIAFVVLRPTGADGSWALDLMRRLPGSVPGAVEACLVGAIQGLGELGVRRLSLGLAPLHGLDPAVGPRSQRLLARAAQALRPFYDYPGLAFYKSKFDPQWLPRYLLVRDRGDLVPASVALLRLHLGGSWPRVVRSLLAGMRTGGGSAEDRRRVG